jgi:hypothetical protein
MSSAHQSVLGGHLGAERTAARIRRDFWWPNMAADVNLMVRRCYTCQRTTNNYDARPAVPTPIPPPRQPNERIHVDLMGPLKTDAGPKYIVAVSDAFTKQLRLATVAQKSATEVAEAIWRHWITIFGVPQVIVTDNGREFNNNLQRCLWTALGIDHRFTSPFYPRCNLQVERTNRDTAKYLRAAILDANAKVTDWERFLPALTLSLNTAVNSATGKSPHEALLGYDPRVPLWPDVSNILGRKATRCQPMPQPTWTPGPRTCSRPERRSRRPSTSPSAAPRPPATGHEGLPLRSRSADLATPPAVAAAESQATAEVGAGHGGAPDQRRRLPRPGSTTGEKGRFSTSKQGAHQAQGGDNSASNTAGAGWGKHAPLDDANGFAASSPTAAGRRVVARGANNPTECAAAAVSPGTAAGGDASRANAHKEAGASGESRGTRKQDGHSPGAAQRVLCPAASVRKALSSLRAAAAATDGGTGCTCTQDPPLPPAA